MREVHSQLPKLSLRLATILDLIERDKPFWDIGCDHGYLGYHLFLEKRVPIIHFVDRSPNVLWDLRARFQRFTEQCGATPGQDNYPDVSFHADLGEKLPAAEISGTVVLAGMGAGTIIRILQALVDRTGRPARWILCPEPDSVQNFEQTLHNFRGYQVLKRLEVRETNKTWSVIELCGI